MRRVLVLGGTAWLGREVAAAAALAGAEVTCAARGRSGQPPENLHFAKLDRLRAGAYDQLVGEWDEVIELSYEPELVIPALEALSPRARHWTLVSSVSVYERNDEPGADESAATVNAVDTTDYAQAKVAAENASRHYVGDRLLIARPGLIAGPGDPSDRFGYWAARLTDAGRGDVLTPTTAKRYVQIIDVADLARWIVEAGAKQVTGVINAVGDSHTLDEFFATTASICDFRGDLVAVSDEWLLEHDVKYWAGPRSLPLWLPPEHTAFAQRSNAAFRTTGGVSRPLTDTIARTVKDERTRGISRHRRSGLTRDEEETLLQTAAR